MLRSELSWLIELNVDIGIASANLIIRPSAVAMMLGTNKEGDDEFES